MTAPRAVSAGKGTLLIACGALAREIIELIRVNGWSHLDLTCLPAHLHNSPQLIPDAVRGKIAEARARYGRIFVVYGDCGTGGELDAVLQEEGVERIAGPHCYQFYAGTEVFTKLSDEEPGTFYLTDYLVRHFDRLVLQGLGLDRFPQLLPDYFGHYSRLLYMAQTEDTDLQEAARQAAVRLGLAYEYRFTGYGELGGFLGVAEAASENAAVPARHSA